ncbi:MAG: rod shape-determining protein MreD [Bacteroidetes Order II. Incertae sedis bacterium]|jgi:rod shape-determining protein MreD|nr:rod shape-determining protein MreD [Bacteroidetes Order II. bacterium]MDG1754431.1 rod shape-determining protein MreD [Rhodothermales bacterium]HAY36006.1 rod shape-determining protein MreD [Bacteroidota bacterium]MBT5248802.1 rod shape-determining protein MreD [Bacteroidetes Order II. bacterium]MBT6200062.1 rod shape-determining protein MreD [Bacteroidetes Order II. bacterium]
MPAPIRTFFLGLGVFLLQWLILGRLTLWGAFPDAVLLFVAWLGVRKGRQWGALGGFFFGFLLDAVYGTWGMHMLVKTMIGFLMGLFPSSEREGLLILPRQALLGGFVIALVHNGIFVTMLALQAGARNTFLVTGLWIGSALYTAFISTLASLLSSR